MFEQISPVSNLLQYKPDLAQMRTPWPPTLQDPLCTRAQQAVMFVAEHMRNPDFVSIIVEQARQQSPYPIGWSPTSLSSGEVGLALFYDYLDLCWPDQGWDRLCQQYLNRAALSSTQMSYAVPSLFGGTAGLALTLSCASRSGKRYQKTLSHVIQGLCEQVLAQPWRRDTSVNGVADRDYDLISGASGPLVYLVSLKQPDALVQSAIEHLLKYLLWLSEPGQIPGQERWYSPPELLPSDQHRENFPQGSFNCGLAHGIPGPLTALALTWLAGYRYPGLRQSISYLSNWLLQHQLHTPWGRDWPDAIPWAKASSPAIWSTLPPTRSAWCYGTPGIARALWLAGLALEDEELRLIAVDAIESVLHRPAKQRIIPSPHLCHGIAGLLQICLHFAQECDSALVKEHIPLLAEEILNTFDPASPFGFRDIHQGTSVDEPGWLTGAPGVAMTLLAATTSVFPDWDRILALS